MCNRMCRQPVTKAVRTLMSQLVSPPFHLCFIHRWGIEPSRAVQERVEDADMEVQSNGVTLGQIIYGHGLGLSIKYSDINYLTPKMLFRLEFFIAKFF